MSGIDVLILIKKIVLNDLLFLQGNRATVPARVGATLLQAAKYQKVDIEGGCDGGGGPTEVQRTPLWNETTYGEGPSCFHCHVKIPSSFKHLLPVQTTAEIEGLKEFWEEEYSTSSYLGCMITLEKKHDGMVVFVPDAPPVDLV